MIVMDSFALPVEGTETRVNAQAQAYEYMADYTENAKTVGRLENVVGWYHSHPGYGCWLSGIDVSTQMLNQQFQEPFVAIVVSTLTFWIVLIKAHGFVSLLPVSMVSGRSWIFTTDEIVRADAS